MKEEMADREKEEMKICSRCGKILKTNEHCTCIEESMRSKFLYENMYLRVDKKEE